MAYETELPEKDRLPWLETVEPDEPEGSGLVRTVLVALIGLVLVTGLAFAGFKILGQRTSDGDGALIAAPEGAYKIKPSDPGGLRLEGEGDITIATSAGEPGNAAIDWSAVPEAPIAGRWPGANVAPQADKATISSVAAPSEKVAEPSPVAVPPPPTDAPRPRVPGAASGGSLVQLGAFPTEAAANEAWSVFAKRFGYVASLGKQVTAAEVNGLSVYRLRVDAGNADAAADVCARLTVAGERCFVTG